LKLLIDLHNHTIASGHAYSTVYEIIMEAKRKGLKIIGITDHGPSMHGVLGEDFTGNLNILPNSYNGVEVKTGVETNILDQEGSLDIPERRLKRLDIIIAGLHDVVIKPWDKNGNTIALIKTMENKYVDIISHPGNPVFPIDKEAVVKMAKETNTLLEINNGSFYNSRVGSKENCYEIAKLCKKYKVPIIVGSDSHFVADVGRFDEALELLETINMPEELVINTSIEKFKEFMKIRNKAKEKL
jgi:putative hydrolase